MATTTTRFPWLSTTRRKDGERELRDLVAGRPTNNQRAAYLSLQDVVEGAATDGQVLAYLDMPEIEQLAVRTLFPDVGWPNAGQISDWIDAL